MYISGAFILAQLRLRDVTCRDPDTQRYRSRAATMDGIAAQAGEDDKKKRYGPGSEGVVVTNYCGN